MNSEHKKKTPRFFYGWVVIVLLALSYGVKICIVSYGAGPMVEPLMEGLHMSATTIGVVFMLRNWIGLASPLAGIAISKWGARTVLGVSGVAMVVFLALTAIVPRTWMFIIAYGLGFGIASIFSSNIAIYTLTSNWWRARLGMANGILTAAMGIGAAVITPAIIWLLDAYGWRACMLILAAIMLVVAVIPQWIWIRNTPEEIGQLPDGGAPDTDNSQASTQDEAAYDWEVKDAIRTRQFWFILIAWAAYVLGVMTFLLYQYVHFDNQGMGALSTPVAFAQGLIVMASGLLIGRMIDSMGSRFVMTAACVFLTVGSALLINAHSPLMVWAYVILFNIGAGSIVSAFPCIIREYFGQKNYAKLQGVCQSIAAVVSGVGPFITGYMIDKTGSLTTPFIFITVLLAASIPLMLAAKPPRHRSTEPRISK